MPHCLPSDSSALPPHANGTTSPREGPEGLGPGPPADDEPSPLRSSTTVGFDTGAEEDADDDAPAVTGTAAVVTPPVVCARFDLGGRDDTDEMADKSPWKVEPNTCREINRMHNQQQSARDTRGAEARRTSLEVRRRICTDRD